MNKKLSQLINNKQILIFDFDGVLADSVEVKTDAFSDLYKAYGKDVQKGIVAHHRANGGMSRFEKFKFYHKQFLNKELSDTESQELSECFSKLVVDRVVNSQEIPGSLEFIKKYYTNKKLAINSATPEEEIQIILKRRHLMQYFSIILGSPASKSKNLKKIISFFEVSKEQCLFFGDANSDYEAAQEIDIDFVAVVGNNQKTFKNALINILNFN